MAQDASNNLYAAKQLAAAAARMLTPKEFVAPPKVYFCQHNGAKFHVDLGKSNVMTLQFTNYKLVTDDIRAQEQLDLIADNPGTFIYTIPHNEAAQIIEREAQEELAKAVLSTAAARVGDAGQQFDPNVPIVPVQTQVQQMPVVMHSFRAAGTGMQSSIDPSQATEAITGHQTTAADQTKPPVDAASSALAALNAMVPSPAVTGTAPNFEALLTQEIKKTEAA